MTDRNKELVPGIPIAELHILQNVHVPPAVFVCPLPSVANKLGSPVWRILTLAPVCKHCPVNHNGDTRTKQQ